MLPSKGGSNPPPPLPDPGLPSNPSDLSLSRRISTKSGTAAKNSREPIGVLSSTNLPFGSSRGVHKPGKNDKGRLPLANLSVNDLFQGSVNVNIQGKGATPDASNPVAIAPIPAAMEVEENAPVASSEGVGMPAMYASRNPDIQESPGNFISDANSSPSKSPCTTNSVSTEVPTPVKILNFDGVVNVEEEGWSTAEEEDDSEQGIGLSADIADVREIQHLHQPNVPQSDAIPADLVGGAPLC
ncbi:hypothetical protein Hanom_Chr15g01337101 [Helianthus anomalus]